jgi:hypothetical protein
MLLLLGSPLLPLSHILQPVQAQTAMSFRTPTPAITEDPNTGLKYTLIFDAQGTFSSSSGYQRISGTFQISSQQDGTILTSGHITHGVFSNGSSGASITMNGLVIKGQDTYYYTINTDCSTFEDNKIIVEIEGGPRPEYSGPVECSPTGEGSTAHPSSSTGTTTTTATTQDRDGDGILDANDNCPNLPNTRCYKEGDTALVVHNSNR